MSRITLADIAAMLVAQGERLDALERAPATVAPARKGKVKVVKPRTFATRADLAAGKGFPCTADEPCGRQLRTLGRAAIHGVDEGGHTPA